MMAPNSIPKSVALLITQYNLKGKPPSVTELTLTRKLDTPLLVGLELDRAQKSEAITLSCLNLPDSYTPEYIGFNRDMEWVKKYWNNPMAIVIDSFTRATNWAGDAYALAQRFKTISGNEASKVDAPRNVISSLDDLRAPVRSN